MAQYGDHDDAEAGDVQDEEQLFRKISWNLLPLFVTMVVLCYVDRTNLAFAAIQLNTDLEFTPKIFGLGSGIFFLGYAFLQIPSNLLLKHTRANIYLACIIAAWGSCACLFAFMTTPGQFYALRLLLGITEAGAFPGMWYFLSRFYPSDRLTLPYTIVDSGISLSHVIAAPVAAACLSLTDHGGLRGWQWLFLLEGSPTLVLALCMLLLLPNSPEDAPWLLPQERSFLSWRLRDPAALLRRGGGSSSSSAAALLPKSGSLAGSSSGGMLPAVGSREYLASLGGSSGGRRSGSNVWSEVVGAFTNKYVWYLGAVKFVRDIAGFGIIFWTPTVVNSIINGTTMKINNHAASLATAAAVMPPPPSDSSALKGVAHGHSADSGVHAALLTAIPFALAASCSFLIAHRSQRLNEKVMHIAVPFVVAGLLYALFPWAVARSPVLGFICLTIGVMGVYSGSGTSVALLQELTAGPGFVVAAPLFNGIGNIGGFIGPFMVGALVQRFNSFAIPSLLMALCLVVSGLAVAAMPHFLTLPPGLRVGFWQPKPMSLRDGANLGGSWTELHNKEITELE